MIELLGIGVPRPPGGWILHQVSVTLERGQLVAVGAPTAEERAAVLDVITSRRMPVEGRLWVDRVPLMSGTVTRLRGLVADIDPAEPLVDRHSVLWNVMAPATRLSAVGRLLRLPRQHERVAAAAALAAVGLADRGTVPVFTLSAADRLRLRLARALAGRRHYIVARELDLALPTHEAMAILVLLRSLTRAERRIVIVSLADPSLASALADRVLAFEDGHLRHDGKPLKPPSQSERRLGLVRT